MGSVTSTKLDAPILAAAQTDIPLVRQPFTALARREGTTRRQVLATLQAARADGRLRRISGIFETRSLGYASALLAFDVEDIVSAGRIVAEHPGTSHVYERLGPVSHHLWATLAVSSDSGLGLSGTAHRLAQLSAASDVQILPALKRYKLDARFGDVRPATPAHRIVQDVSLDATAQQLVRTLQNNVPLTTRPFDRLAADLHMTTSEFLLRARALRSAGVLRRFAAVVNHRRLGAVSNVMTVWPLAGKSADRAGAICTASTAVSHCFLRRSGPQWPYGF